MTSPNKRLTSPPRLNPPQQQLQPTIVNNAGNGNIHASPMYITSTPTAKRKRVEATPHYASYTPTYLSGSVLRGEKVLDDGSVGKTVMACTNGPMGNSVVVDMNSSAAAAAAHRLVESVVNNSQVVCSTPSQVRV